MRYLCLIVILLMALLSTHIRIPLSCLGTKRAGTTHRLVHHSEAYFLMLKATNLTYLSSGTSLYSKTHLTVYNQSKNSSGWSLPSNSRISTLKSMVLAWNCGSGLAILHGSSSLDESMVWLSTCSCLIGSDWRGSSFTFCFYFKKAGSCFCRYSFLALVSDSRWASSQIFLISISFCLMRASKFPSKIMLELILLLDCI